MKEKKIAMIALDWVCIACVIYTLVWGIMTQVETGLPFSDSPTGMWILWFGWAIWCGVNPIKRIFGGYKDND